MFEKYSSAKNVDTDLDILSQMTSDIVLGLFNDVPIGCDYPYSSWFIDNLYGSYSDQNILTVDGLRRLMSDFGLIATKPKRSLALHLTSSSYNKCYSADELVDIFQFSRNSMSKSDLALLSPALTYLQVKGVCMQKNKIIKSGIINSENRNETQQSAAKFKSIFKIKIKILKFLLFYFRIWLW